jgi:uncharacterized membrane protein
MQSANIRAMAVNDAHELDRSWSGRTKIGWGLLVTGSVLLIVTSSRYLTVNPDVYFERQRDVYEAHTIGIISHIFFMMMAAALGPTQFLRFLRNRHPYLHRLAGRFYVISAVAGALAGLYMAQFSASGSASGWGFAMLALGVLVTTGRAFYLIRHGRIQEHREWMTRSYALIFAAVTLRLYLPILEGVFGEHAGYAAVAWLSWIPNLLVAEWIIRGHLRRRLDGPRPATIGR